MTMRGEERCLECEGAGEEGRRATEKPRREDNKKEEEG